MVTENSFIMFFCATLRHYKIDELPGLWATGVFTALTECQSGPTKGRKSQLSTEGPEAADRQHVVCRSSSGCTWVCGQTGG